jgi:hypothetical protein
MNRDLAAITGSAMPNKNRVGISSNPIFYHEFPALTNTMFENERLPPAIAGLLKWPGRRVIV